MNGWVDIRKDAAHVARERRQARELRRSAWWQAQCARGRCHYCGAATAPAEITMDHIVPVARGGRSTRGNVVPSCPACNRDKGCLTQAERILDKLEQEAPGDETELS